MKAQSERARSLRASFILGAALLGSACDAAIPFLSQSQEQSSSEPEDAKSIQKTSSAVRPLVQASGETDSARLNLQRGGATPPAPRVGMAYIPAGALVVGTPAGVLPRRPDRELSGEQVMLDGFFIDRFAYPNEEGGIPTTNVTLEEAARLCERQDKRLCTELEWERACKGPENRIYEYGDTYDADVCKTGSEVHLRPSGYHVACQSDYGVHDLHGGPFEWTQSSYARGSSAAQRVVRGGDAPNGSLVGRCANLESRDKQFRGGGVGFRCCAGAVNEEKVDLEILQPAGLRPKARFADSLSAALLAAIPKDVHQYLRAAGPIRSQRVWSWHPVANEEIYLSAFCGRGMPRPIGPRCGLLVAGKNEGKVSAFAWISSGRWVAQLHQRQGIHDLWLVGGDERGGFKRPMTYAYGDVQVGEQSRGSYQKK